jgi:hypothetical protein
LTVSRLDDAPAMSATHTATDIRLRHGRLQHPPNHRVSSPTRPSHAAPREPAPGDPGIIRAWARAHGYVIADRGRLSKEIADAYKLANPDLSPPGGAATGSGWGSSRW